VLCHLKERRKKFRIYRCHPVYRLDEGVEGSGMGLLLIGGPLAEDSATKLKRGQINVSILCMCTVYGVLSLPPPPPVAEICARLSGNFCQ
jgi:hypothetical protein